MSTAGTVRITTGRTRKTASRVTKRRMLCGAVDARRARAGSTPMPSVCDTNALTSRKREPTAKSATEATLPTLPRSSAPARHMIVASVVAPPSHSPRRTTQRRNARSGAADQGLGSHSWATRTTASCLMASVARTPATPAAAIEQHRNSETELEASREQLQSALDQRPAGRSQELRLQVEQGGDRDEDGQEQQCAEIPLRPRRDDSDGGDGDTGDGTGGHLHEDRGAVRGGERGLASSHLASGHRGHPGVGDDADRGGEDEQVVVLGEDELALPARQQHDEGQAEQPSDQPRCHGGDRPCDKTRLPDAVGRVASRRARQVAGSVNGQDAERGVTGALTRWVTASTCAAAREAPST